MEAQKPLLSDVYPSQSNPHHDPTTAGHAGGRLSETESFLRLLEMLARELIPPPWALRCIIAVAIVYYTPFVLIRWFNALEKLILLYRDIHLKKHFREYHSPTSILSCHSVHISIMSQTRRLSPASRIRRTRQRVTDRWREETEGVDLVAMALENPSDVMNRVIRRGAILGREPYYYDEVMMVRRITGGVNNLDSLFNHGADPAAPGTLPTVDCWKLIVIDCRPAEDSADLDRQCRAQLLAEELQTPEERAREAVRDDGERTARRNAKLMILALEKLSPEKCAMMLERRTLYTVWQKVMPKAPSWIEDIVDEECDWDFVFCRSAEVMRRVGDCWNDALERLEGLDELFYPENRAEQPIFATAGPSSIHSADENFLLYWSPVHFRTHRQTLDEDDGILDNTLIVIDSECVHPDLMTPPAGRDADEDGYQGRLKVPFTCLQAWFYAARLKGIDMKAMWKKAQGHPQQLWVCNSKPQQEWKHEPWVDGDQELPATGRSRAWGDGLGLGLRASRPTAPDLRLRGRIGDAHDDFSQDAE
ncbi:hypothetical protein CMUS01_06626 [Colletotrichum musicola]|uniref:Uncharacterized protein n=1 Tax=Colletotrichum musicola TaxID=2175873 RepID=A0A8H6KLE4_9PEZI|nr:hypothetical protein CMUS01_06626 [Colletotrichum musicola]